MRDDDDYVGDTLIVNPRKERRVLPKSPFPVTVFYDSQCAMCQATMAKWAHSESSPAASFIFVPQTDPSRASRIIVSSADGTWTGAEALYRVYRYQNKRILAALWGGAIRVGLGTSLYDWIAQHRQGIARIFFRKHLEIPSKSH